MNKQITMGLIAILGVATVGSGFYGISSASKANELTKQLSDKDAQYQVIVKDKAALEENLKKFTVNIFTEESFKAFVDNLEANKDKAFSREEFTNLIKRVQGTAFTLKVDGVEYLMDATEVKLAMEPQIATTTAVAETPATTSAPADNASTATSTVTTVDATTTAAPTAPATSEAPATTSAPVADSKTTAVASTSDDLMKTIKTNSEYKFVGVIKSETGKVIGLEFTSNANDAKKPAETTTEKKDAKDTTTPTPTPTPAPSTTTPATDDKSTEPAKDSTKTTEPTNKQ